MIAFVPLQADPDTAACLEGLEGLRIGDEGTDVRPGGIPAAARDPLSPKTYAGTPEEEQRDGGAAAAAEGGAAEVLWQWSERLEMHGNGAVVGL